MNRQPDRRLIGRRPLDPVPFVRRNVDEIAGLHLERLILETQRCRSLQQHNPFMLLLIVPEPFG